jgi:Trypsin-like peptidase domain
MKAWKKPILAAAIVIVTSRALPSQTVDGAARMALVVKVKSHFENHGDETAAGLVVGHDQQFAYFITARHAVVFDTGTQVLAAKSVRVQFSTSPQTFDAKVFDHSDPILDLAVIYLPRANTSPDQTEVPRSDVIAGGSVTIIGHPAAGDWSVWEGRIVNEFAPEGDVHHFITTSNPSLAKGYSGGPEFDQHGNFVGMQVAYETTYGIASRSSDILTQLKAWRIPTNNLTTATTAAKDNQKGFVQTGTGPEPMLLTDTELIKAVLGDYEDAYNHADANMLWKVWPNPPAKTKQSIERYFASAISIRAKLDLSSTEISSNRLVATVSGRVSQQFTPRVGGAPPTQEDKIVFTLQKMSGAWIIVDVR